MCLAHGSKSNNVHTSEKKADQRADQGEERKISSERIGSSALDLQDRQDGTYRVESGFRLAI